MFRRIGAVLFLLVAGGSGFLTVTAWASAGDVGPVTGRSDDAQLVMLTFGFVTLLSLLAAVILMKSFGGGN